jgi:hypothetical protein
MGSDKLTSFFNRVFFLAAFVLLALAVVDRVVAWFGYTILGAAYSAGRLLEFAAIMLLFVLALLVRQMRDGLHGKGP